MTNPSLPETCLKIARSLLDVSSPRQALEKVHGILSMSGLFAGVWIIPADKLSDVIHPDSPNPGNQELPAGIPPCCKLPPQFPSEDSCPYSDFLRTHQLHIRKIPLPDRTSCYLAAAENHNVNPEDCREILGQALEDLEKKLLSLLEKETLRKSQTWYRSIFQSLFEGVAIEDPETMKILELNSAGEKLFHTRFSDKMTVEEQHEALVDEAPFTFAHKRELVEKIMTTDQPVQVEWKIRDSGEKFRWFEIIAGKCEIDGRPLILTQARDITKRKALKAIEEELIQAGARFGEVFDSVNDGILIILLSDSGPGVMCNRTASEYFGFTTEETETLITREHGLENFQRCGLDILQLQEKIADKDQILFETAITHPSGRVFHVEINMKRAQIESNPCLLASIRDIETRRSLQQKLIAKNRELEDFAFMVGHEVKNSILAFKVLTDQLKRSPSNIEVITNKINDNSNTLIAFINQLLDLARSGRVLYEIREIHISLIIRFLFNQIKPVDLQGVLTIDKNLPVIHGDEKGIHQVIENILLNSFQFRDPKKDSFTIDVTYQQQNNSHIIVFRDNGTGSDTETLKRIFDVGFSTRKKQGAGFGLAISQKIIDAHGGTIAAFSKGPGQGMEITLQLPCRTRIPSEENIG